MFRNKKESKLIINDIVEDNTFDPTSKRVSTPILIIDDNKFAQIDNLRNNDFKVTQIEDLDDFAKLKGYAIILCDIDGVGLKLGFKDGADLMVEIKKRYPMKPLIAYSSRDYKIDKISSKVNQTMDKDLALPLWIKNIDNLIRDLYNPKAQWLEARKLLLERNVDIYTVAKLESDFIKHMNEKNVKSFNTSELVNILHDNVKPIIQSLIANYIFAG